MKGSSDVCNKSTIKGIANGWLIGILLTKGGVALCVFKEFVTNVNFKMLYT